MAAPFPLRVELTAPERDALTALSRRHTTGQQLAVRARIVLAAAAGQPSLQIAAELGLARETVRLWRQRWVESTGVDLADRSVAERLADAPRPGRPSRITAAQQCQIVATACAAPASRGRPISQWTSREIADELITHGIVSQISPRHAARLVKKGTSNPTESRAG
jgi:putative transposase